MTEEEYDRWCMTVEDRTEFVDGKVVFLMAESRQDEDVRWFLGKVLGTFVEERALGKIHGPNFMIRPRAGLRRVPDLQFIGRQRLPQLQKTYLTGGPDLAIEIVSDDSDERDRIDKYAEYQRAGVGEYWIIDSRLRRFDAFALQPDGRYQAIPVEEGMARSQAVPGFWIRVEWLWQDPPPRLLGVLRELGITP